MGLYDSVFFDCPNCGSKVEAQSKVDDCYMQVFSVDAVPLVVAADITDPTDGPLMCRNCERTYRPAMSVDIPRTVPMHLAPVDERPEPWQIRSARYPKATALIQPYIDSHLEELRAAGITEQWFESAMMMDDWEQRIRERVEAAIAEPTP